MPTPPHARHAVRAAMQAARDRHVDEPTIIYCGRHYPESVLRALQDAGQLDTLPVRLAAGVDTFLSGIDHATRHLRIAMIGTGDGGWIGFMPASARYLLPPGWTLTPAGKCYLFPETEDDRC